MEVEVEVELDHQQQQQQLKHSTVSPAILMAIHFTQGKHHPHPFLQILT
jgi:hypothetical protein